MGPTMCEMNDGGGGMAPQIIFFEQVHRAHSQLAAAKLWGRGHAGAAVGHDWCIAGMSSSDGLVDMSLTYCTLAQGLGEGWAPAASWAASLLSRAGHPLLHGWAATQGRNGRYMLVYKRPARRGEDSWVES